MNYEQVIKELKLITECMKDMLPTNKGKLTCTACKSSIHEIYEWTLSEANKE